MIRAYRDKHAMDIRIARIFNTYGPRMRLDDGRVIPNFMRQALTDAPLTVYGDGSQTRAFCHVDDLIEGLIALMASDVDDPVNIGNPDERTILELAEVIREVTGSASHIIHEDLPPQDPPIRRPDISMARSRLGGAGGRSPRWPRAIAAVLRG
jgi:Nucleoside-diphosphate-sugar epimerases